MRRAWGTAVMAVIALGVTACAGATTSDAGNTGAAGGGDTSGVTEDTITLGMVTPLSGPAAALGTDGRAGAEALVARVNDEGGINGRQLVLQVQDDQYDPKLAVAGARYFATEQPVLAAWGSVGTATTLAAVPAYESARMPLLFPLAPSAEIEAYERSFQLTASWSDQYQLFSEHTAQNPDTAGRKFAVMYQNDGPSAEILEGFRQGPMNVVAEVPFERTATSYSAQVELLKNAGATDVFVSSSAAQFAVILKQADQIGFQPQWWGSYGVSSPDLIKLAGPLAEGVRTVNPYTPASADVPGAREFHEAMDTYQPDATKSGYALNSWIGGLIIVDALERAGDDLTRESFVEALQSTSDLDVGGLMPPVTLTAEDRVASRCLQEAVVEGGSFVPQADFYCADER